MVLAIEPDSIQRDEIELDKWFLAYNKQFVLSKDGKLLTNAQYRVKSNSSKDYVIKNQYINSIWLSPT